MKLVANWKTFDLDFRTMAKLANVLKDAPSTSLDTSNGVEYTVLPSALCLHHVADLLKNHTVSIGTQDCSEDNSEQSTGELRASMIARCGGSVVMVGHLERQHIETTTQKFRKISNALSVGLNIILCAHKSNIDDMIEEIHELLPNDMSFYYKNFCIAYEPVQQTVDIDTIITIHNELRKYLDNRDLQDVSILYGGSVNSSNIEELIQRTNVDGFLIGRASVDVDEFKSIINKVDKS